MKKIDENIEIFPGQVWVASENLNVLDDRNILNMTVVNRGDRPIQVGSHFNFFEVNKYLDFDRKLAYGMRLAIPAGTAVRFEPGMSLEISLIEIDGERCCYGLNALVMGSLDENKDKAFQLAQKQGFKGVEDGN